MSIRSRGRGWNLAVACAVVGVMALGLASAAGAAEPAMTGSKHDFRFNPTYTGLSALAKDELCRACHIPHNAAKGHLLRDYGTDWTTTFTGTDGASHQLILPESLLCMGCHDGTIAMPSGSPDLIPDGNKAKVNPGADPHYWNDVLPGYGTEPATAVTPGLLLAAPGPQGGTWTAVSPVNLSTRLPLYTSGSPSEPRMACTTCHDPHLPAGRQYLLRSEQAYGDLCVTCHSDFYPH